MKIFQQKNQEVMQELLPNLIDSDYYWANNGVIQVVDGLEFIIYFEVLDAVIILIPSNGMILIL